MGSSTDWQSRLGYCLTVPRRPPLGFAKAAGIWEVATILAHVAFISHHFAKKHN